MTNDYLDFRLLGKVCPISDHRGQTLYLISDQNSLPYTAYKREYPQALEYSLGITSWFLLELKGKWYLHLPGNLFFFAF